MMYCKFCKRESKTKQSVIAHEIHCKLNPNAKSKIPSYGMKGKKGSNQWIKGTAKPLTEEIRKSFGNGVRDISWDSKRKEEHSKKMKKAVIEHPDAYNSGNRGRVKQIIYDGIKFHGKWELEFYLWCKNNNVDIRRCDESFDYIWNGNRKYFPDFYLSELDSYVEIKGYETDRDRAKWSNFPKKLIIIKKDSIMKIKNGLFELGSLA